MAAVAVVALVLGTPATAVASPPTTTAPDAAPRTAIGTASPTTVTLLTGDRVTVTASGSAAVSPGPGRTHLRFLTTRDRGHLTVLPQDALPLVRAGRVDRRLFDVTGLIAAGYDDSRRDHLPVLVTGDAGARQRTAVPAGLTVTVQLPAIGGVAATADKQRATAVWAALTGAGARVGTAGVPTGSGSTAAGRSAWTTACRRSARRPRTRRASPARAYASRCWTPASTPTTPT